MKGNFKTIASAGTLVAVCGALTLTVRAQSEYWTEPAPKYQESFQQRENQSRPSGLYNGNQSGAYYDKYERGHSDYPSHVYGEDSDYLYWPGESSRDQTHRSASNAIRNGQTHTLKGEIQQIRPLQLENARGNNESHHVARVRLHDGRSVLVDLGPNRGISAFDLEQGDRVQIQGRVGTIQGRSVLFANTLSVNGQQFRIRRGDGKSSTLSFGGEVEGYHPEWVSDRWGNDHQVVKISNTSGETHLVDLPPDMTWRDLELRIGCQFKVKGTRETLGNRRVVSATSIRVDGDEKLDW